MDGQITLRRRLSLLQTRRSWTGPELAVRIGTTERTVRRDIERLRGLGYRVERLAGALTWLVWPFEVVEGEDLQRFVRDFVNRLRP